ncbi:lysis system o-spanin lipoprotein Rz1, partial [Escherichia coli]
NRPPPPPGPCRKPPAPAAGVNQPAADLQTPLNGIIASSENG